MCRCNCKDSLFELHIRSVEYIDSLQRLKKMCAGYFRVIFELKFYDRLDRFFKCVLDVSLQLQGHILFELAE